MFFDHRKFYWFIAKRALAMLGALLLVGAVLYGGLFLVAEGLRDNCQSEHRDARTTTASTR